MSTVRVCLAVDVCFSSINKKPWRGMRIYKEVKLAVAPSAGMVWHDAVWPEDQLTIQSVHLHEGSDPMVDCHCRYFDQTGYGTFEDMRIAYMEDAGWQWESGSEYDMDVKILPDWATE